MSDTEGLLVAVRVVHFGAAIVLFGEMFFAVLASAYGSEGCQPSGSVRLGSSPVSQGRRLGVGHHGNFRGMLAGSGVGADERPATGSAPRLLGLRDGSSDDDLRPRLVGSCIDGIGVDGHVADVASRAAAASALGLAHVCRHRRRAADRSSLGWSRERRSRSQWLGSPRQRCRSPARGRSVAGWFGPARRASQWAGPGTDRRAIDECANATTRFGNWAALCVAVIFVTGIVNAYYLLPDPRALLDTSYGNLLLLKLLVFSIMLAIAIVNRTRLTGSLRADFGSASPRVAAAARLRRNAWMEQALGAAVIVLVAALGVTSPPMRM